METSAAVLWVNSTPKIIATNGGLLTFLDEDDFPPCVCATLLIRHPRFPVVVSLESLPRLFRATVKIARCVREKRSNQTVDGFEGANVRLPPDDPFLVQLGGSRRCRRIRAFGLYEKFIACRVSLLESLCTHGHLLAELKAKASYTKIL
jgi:hypothetical protein